MSADPTTATPMPSAAGHPDTRGSRVRLGVSACLVGREVRYDGRDKAEDLPLDAVDDLVEWVAVCPEIDIGLGIPREPIELVATGGDVRLLGVTSRADHTARMRTYAAERVRWLRDAGVDGYVLKARSPSCGLEGVPVHDRDGEVVARGPGMFADALVRSLPHLPVVEERDLESGPARFDFLERVAARRRWRCLVAGESTADELRAFHADHALTLAARDRERLEELEHLVASVDDEPLDEVLADYGSTLLAALARPASPEGHADVLAGVIETLGAAVTVRQRRDLAGLAAAVRDGQADPDAVRDRLRGLAAGAGAPPWLARQTYLAADERALLTAAPQPGFVTSATSASR